MTYYESLFGTQIVKDLLELISSSMSLYYA